MSMDDASWSLHDVATIMVPEMEKLRHKEVKELPQSHDLIYGEARTTNGSGILTTRLLLPVTLTIMPNDVVLGKMV